MGFTNSTVAGDTRFDRVLAVAEKFQPIPAIEYFVRNSKVMVAGSTWPEDEVIIGKAIQLLNDQPLKLIIAPHEINEKGIESIKKMMPAVRFSEWLSFCNSSSFNADSSVYPGMGSTSHCALIIDNFGMLSRIYKYGDITMVGGGMTSYGVHNVLEAAVYNKPVIIGPFYKKYIEAIGLVESSGAIVIRNEKEMADAILKLLNDPQFAETTSSASGAFVRKYAGASKKILDHIQENRLLMS